MENNEEIKEEVKKENKENKKDKKNNKEIEKLHEENASLNDKLLRVTAEMQNMRKRYEDEISRIYKYDGEKIIQKLLAVLDNFERAINMDTEDKEDEISKFLSGFKIIYSDLRSYLESIGVKEIECMKQPFNPETMEAVMTEKAEGVEAGIVIDVLQKGYTYNDKVVRHAMVMVSE